MNGSAVFDFTQREVASSIIDFMERLQIQLENVNCYLMHQANKFII